MQTRASHDNLNGPYALSPVLGPVMVTTLFAGGTRRSSGWGRTARSRPVCSPAPARGCAPKVGTAEKSAAKGRSSAVGGRGSGGSAASSSSGCSTPGACSGEAAPASALALMARGGGGGKELEEHVHHCHDKRDAHRFMAKALACWAGQLHHPPREAPTCSRTGAARRPTRLHALPERLRGPAA